MKVTKTNAVNSLPFSISTLREGINNTNGYLVKLPTEFGLKSRDFYTILNQRNLSGFVGEILKHAISSVDPSLCPNPHPDGRPDLLILSTAEIKKHFLENCFDKVSKAPLRSQLAPFVHGGVEIKCTIGKLVNANDMKIGESRVAAVTGLTYWAHHAHSCELLGIYYDFCSKAGGAPQIKAAFFTSIATGDWNKVSVGNPEKKKTSNTSLKASGLRKLYQSLILYSDEGEYIHMLDRLNIAR